MLSAQEENRNAFQRYSEVNYSDEEWAISWVGLWSVLCSAKVKSWESLQFDPKRSVLYASYPDLLDGACDIEIPIIYDLSTREFGVMVMDGGFSQLSFRFDPFTGKQLPSSLRGERVAAIEALGSKPSRENDEIPARFNDETWWKDSYVSGTTP